MEAHVFRRLTLVRVTKGAPSAGWAGKEQGSGGQGGEGVVGKERRSGGQGKGDFILAETLVHNDTAGGNPTYLKP